MLDRRIFLAGCCAMHATQVLGQQSQSPPQFACGTVDRSVGLDSGSQLEVYASEGGFKPLDLAAAVKEFQFTPYGTANFAHRWRNRDGLTPDTGLITLGVHFLNGSHSQREVVERGANQWITGTLSKRMKFEFGVPRDRSQISVLFGNQGNNSIVGRASADYTATQATMNLQDVVEYVVAHEFGHAIGLQHEHQNPKTSISWNKKAVIEEMALQGWSPQMCEANIFGRYGSTYACIGSPAFDTRSIMLYPIPSRWTFDGYSTGTNTAISAGDRACVAGIYSA